MNGDNTDDFLSHCEIDEPFEQFVASYSDYRVLTSTTRVNFTRAPSTDVCSASDAAVLRVIRYWSFHLYVCHYVQIRRRNQLVTVATISPEPVNLFQLRRTTAGIFLV